MHAIILPKKLSWFLLGLGTIGQSQPQSIQYESLKAIGLVLYDAVKAGKAIQAFEEASKVAIKKAREDILGILNKDWFVTQRRLIL